MQYEIRNMLCPLWLNFDNTVEKKTEKEIERCAFSIKNKRNRILFLLDY